MLLHRETGLNEEGWRKWARSRVSLHKLVIRSRLSNEPTAANLGWADHHRFLPRACEANHSFVVHREPIAERFLVSTTSMLTSVSEGCLSEPCDQSQRLG